MFSFQNSKNISKMEETHRNSNVRTQLVHKFSRRKYIDLNENTTELKRVLTTLDLTFLGIGSTIGVGVYVLAGSVARNDAGPAVLLSFLIAAFASVLAGLCYAEFGARVPKAGSAYIYTYVCLGELIAFVVGWNLIMEYLIGVASVAKGYSTHLDALLNGTMKTTFEHYFPMNGGTHLSTHFDPFAFAVTMVIASILAFGVKESSLFNCIFTGIKLLVVVFIIIVGSIYANPENWAIDPKSVNVTALTLEHPGKKLGKLGTGGFVPFGFGGLMRGAATCFYAFVGFDCIATTGEEAKNPRRSIPLAFFLCLTFVTVAYLAISTVLTMMVPYYLQDEHAPLPEAFSYVDFEVGKWIVSVGALVGFSASLLGTMFPLPRVIYAMASDGLLFGFLAKVHPRSQTPVLATLLAGIFGATISGIFELDALVDMMSIGTLTAYTCVAIGVLVLRYQRVEDGSVKKNLSTSKVEPGPRFWRTILAHALNLKNSTNPTKQSSNYTAWVVFVYSLLAIVLCALATFLIEPLLNLNLGYIILTSVIGLLLVVLLFSMSLQPVSKVELAFKVPLVPLVPGLSILINLYLIFQLSGPTWIRFSVWLFVGMCIYCYCWFSGASDRAFSANMEYKAVNQRRQSKISANAEHVANTNL